MEQVSLTAQWTAAVRANESNFDSALFNDEFASLLAKPDGFRLLDRYSGAGVGEFVAIRTRYFDDAIERILQSGEIHQVVLIAAGMDTRALRLVWPESATLFEVDHTALLEEKRKRLKKTNAESRVKVVEVGVDLSGDWLPSLSSAGFDKNAPTLWIAEGLLFFLPEVTVSELLSTLHRTSAEGSRLLTDMPSKSLLESPASTLFLSTLRRDGIPWLFGSDDPGQLLQSHGWHTVDLREPGEVEAAGSRWPYPVQPKCVPNVSRSWLLEAVVDVGDA